VKLPWPASQPALPELRPVRPTHREVLIETDMPELVLAELDGAPWLGLLSETDSTGVARWLYAPLTSEEERALLVGAVEIWECFRKPEVLLVDESETEDTVVALDGLTVPLEALPKRGFVLPTWARPGSPSGSDGAAPFATSSSVTSLVETSEGEKNLLDS